MRPIINSTESGKLSIDEHSIEFDFIINAEGKVVRREKNGQKGKDMQILSLNEATDYYDPDVNEMIIGCRADDKLMLSNEATDFFEEKRCKIKLLPLHEAIVYWNRYEGHAVGIFHIAK